MKSRKPGRISRWPVGHLADLISWGDDVSRLTGNG